MNCSDTVLSMRDVHTQCCTQLTAALAVWCGDDSMSADCCSSNPTSALLGEYLVLLLRLLCSADKSQVVLIADADVLTSSVSVSLYD
jgi:hypothetical protein